MDANGVLQACYDPVNQQINATNVGTASNSREGLDENGVWDQVYDPATNTIRVVTV